MRTHVQAWRLYHEREVPPGLVVMHLCHNPPCCNPRHLRVGTKAENEAMKLGDGTMTYGERNGQARLTADVVREIRRRCAAGEPQMSVAVWFGVCYQHVSDIVRRKRWAHLD